MSEYRIIQGDALSVLKTLPDESVQCSISSPPYYGLRSYGTEPMVWDNHNGCDHVWGDTVRNPKADPRTPEEKVAQGGTVGTNVATLHWSNGNLGNFCIECNAWRGELGLEPTFQLYIQHLIQIYAEVKRVLKKDGTCFVNLGDSYSGSWGNYVAQGSTSAKALDKRRKDRYGTFKPSAADRNGAMGVQPKSLMNIPARFAIAMTDELKMIQRNEIIWHKRACMPSSATDRFTVDFEPIFFFAKNPKYKFNQQLEPVQESSKVRLPQPNLPNQQGSIGHGGAKTNGNVKALESTENRNKRTTWTVNFEPSSDPHYASYPTKLIEPMILAGTDAGDAVLDPFAGTGTTLLTALRHQRDALGIELQPKYVEILQRRLSAVQVKLDF